MPSNLSNISRETPFVFKGDSGRPRVSIPAKITSISQHQYIKTTTRGYYLICRNSEGMQQAQIIKEDRIIYRSIFQLSEGALKDILPSSNKTLKESKRIRGKRTVWKCSECAVPIYRPGEPCWDIAHRRLFSK